MRAWGTVARDFATELDAAAAPPVIAWLRQEMRLDDNPALEAAAAIGRRVACRSAMRAWRASASSRPPPKQAPWIAATPSGTG